MKCFVILTNDEAKAIERELLGRVTRADNALYCKEVNPSGFKIYNAKTMVTVFTYFREGKSEYNPKVFDARKYLNS